MLSRTERLRSSDTRREVASDELPEVDQDQDASWVPPFGGFSKHDQMGGDQNSLKGFWSNLAWERLSILQEELESAAGKKDVWTTRPQPDQEEQRTGWWTFSPTLTSSNFNSFKQHFESYKLHVDLEICSWLKLRVLTRQQVGSEQSYWTNR